MSLDTYANLKTEISAWSARSDSTFTDQVDNFIDMFEAEANLKLRLEEMLTATTVVTVAATATANLPSDFEGMKHIEFSSGVRHISFSTKKQGSDTYVTSTSGRPTMVSLYPGNKLVFYPTPDAVYTFNVDYYATIPALSVSQTTNWLLTKFPQAYLFGALKYAKSFIQDENRKQMIDQGLDKAFLELGIADDKKTAGGPGMRMRVDIGVR